MPEWRLLQLKACKLGQVNSCRCIILQLCAALLGVVPQQSVKCPDDSTLNPCIRGMRMPGEVLWAQLRVPCVAGLGCPLATLLFTQHLSGQCLSLM